ncbi:unnamed protein product [Rotaria socialis]|uniref:Calponin-homology (CH) domain-containing protein n=1 Tax=Rotaria socialis TaxID=392032 RepID=A0A817W0E0_9BILA|nr:unnamed protein product [Rotaria socialis]CAF3239421.1 unnamed protein product [Rotaria socialis]CAF3348297.1 unnamed protein product [Rotaria socialis]CAF3366403.1 unnamed protein product [Rotaria socialis]CAF3383950.1 unnamed protein product [Rotaria socialis]
MALDRAVKDKIFYKQDSEQEKAAREWIEAVTGERFPTDDYEEALHDGIILCKLMNKLKPGSVPKIHTQGCSIKLRENIGLFQNAARAYGVNASEVFQAVDCFDKQNIQQVTLCIFALNRIAQKNNFNGPKLKYQTKLPVYD